MFTAYKKRSFILILIFMIGMGGLAGLALMYLDNTTAFILGLAPQKGLAAAKIGEWIGVLNTDTVYQWILPSALALFILSGLIFWALLVASVSGIFNKEEAVDAKPQSRSGKKDFIDQKIEQERKRRLFLHTLSVLQREGRLLDFFDEDLSLYEDAQIGAAVRSIQEDCKKAVKKYINLKPVLDGVEGDTIIIEEGFDIDAVNLVGNVAGNPPFEGVIKHPGWRAGKKEVPKLSDVQDPGIMTPAEVEIP